MMVARKTANTDFSRQSSVNMAIKQATSVRIRLGIEQHLPVCIYDICDQLDVTVRFLDNNMEGMYKKSKRPKIFLSSKRPLARRAYNCAHELGHHQFGDGSSIDELREEADRPSWEDPKEFKADSFAAHLLIPTIGLRGAFNSRGLDMQTATPEQIYVIACDFGVGYTTLITHMSVGLRLINSIRAAELKKASPKQIRTKLLGQETSRPLIVAGAKRLNPRIDTEVGSLILLPKDAFVEADRLKPIGQFKNASLFEVMKPGIAQIRTPEWSAFARIARKEYMGMARFRHLEE